MLFERYKLVVVENCIAIDEEMNKILIKFRNVIKVVFDSSS